MQSEFSPPLTRLDVVMWFLRVQLWLSVVGLVSSFVQPRQFWYGSALQNLFGWGIAILALLLFPGVLANSVLGASAREPLASAFELRSLVVRCVGIALFVGALGSAVSYSLYVIYSLVTGAGIGRGLGSSLSWQFMLFQVGATVARFLLGFVLAFGPNIRDSLRGR